MSNCVCVCISYKSAVAAAFSFFFFFFFSKINSHSCQLLSHAFRFQASSPWRLKLFGFYSGCCLLHEQCDVVFNTLAVNVSHF